MARLRTGLSARPHERVRAVLHVGAGSFSAPSRPTGASTPRHRGRRIPHALTGALDSVLRGTERETDSGPTPRPVCRGAPPNQAHPPAGWDVRPSLHGLFSTEVLRPVEGGGRSRLGGGRSCLDREPLATGGGTVDKGCGGARLANPGRPHTEALILNSPCQNPSSSSPFLPNLLSSESSTSPFLKSVLVSDRGARARIDRANSAS